MKDEDTQDSQHTLVTVVKRLLAIISIARQAHYRPSAAVWTHVRNIEDFRL